ncbi:MAG TPA: hypothetical protein VIX73_11735 [Kofleriaceae bacterium]
MLADAVEAFQAEIRRLAFATVRAVIEEEIARRRPRPDRAHRGKRRSAQPVARQLELGFTHLPQRQLELPLARPAAHDPAQHPEPQANTQPEYERAGNPDADVAPATATGNQQPGGQVGSGGRTRWTRETVISELATWLLSGTAIDAQFMARHGPRGLSTAARRIFGRFDAALNLAALHNAKRYPEGPPERGVGRGTAVLAAASRRRQE